jgi:hypothetical protein
MSELTQNHHLTEVICGFWFDPASNVWDSTYFGKYYEKIGALGYNEKQEMPLYGNYCKYEPNKKDKNTDSYYILTPIQVPKTSMPDIFISTGQGRISLDGKHLDMLDYSVNMFSGTQPMGGIELKSLYDAMEMQLNSSTDIWL